MTLKQELQEIKDISENVEALLARFNKIQYLRHTQYTKARFENLISALRVHKNQITESIELSKPQHNNIRKSI